MPTKLEERQGERTYAREKLLELLVPGDTVYTVCNHVSRSSMSRSIDLLIGRGRDVEKITYWASRALGDDKRSERIDQTNGGIVVGGCGMDMGFHLVYGLSRTLWPDGFDCVGPIYYLTGSELSSDGVPSHLRVVDIPGDVSDAGGSTVYAEPLTGANGFLPAYLSTRHNCPSNDHSNRKMNFHHSDGGYALNHRWL